MARPRIHKSPDYPIFEMFDAPQLQLLSNNYYRASYIEAIESGRQPATRRFRHYWITKLGRDEQTLFGGER